MPAPHGTALRLSRLTPPQSAIIERQPCELRFSGAGALGSGSHASESNPRGGNPPIPERELEGRHHGRNVLVEAFRYLVAAESLVRLEPRYRDAQEHLARAAILLAIGDEEILKRQPANGRSLDLFDGGAERNQGRRRVADR